MCAGRKMHSQCDFNDFIFKLFSIWTNCEIGQQKFRAVVVGNNRIQKELKFLIVH